MRGGLIVIRCSSNSHFDAGMDNVLQTKQNLIQIVLCPSIDPPELSTRLESFVLTETLPLSRSTAHA